MNLLQVGNGSFGVGLDKDAFHRGKMKFCLLLHHPIPIRSYVGDVIDQCDSFISGLLIPRMIDELKQELDFSAYLKAKHIIEGYTKPFEQFSTEKRRLNIFRKESVYIDPESFRVVQRSVRKFLCDGTRASSTFEPVYVVRIPLIRALGTFFQLPGVYDAAKTYMAGLEEARAVINYRQGGMWRTKYLEFSKTHDGAFNLYIWYDDSQTGNGLGSAAGEQKIGGVFVRCPCLRPRSVNKLYSLFTAIIFYSKQGGEFGNGGIFSKPIEELYILHDIELRIIIDGERKTLFFALTQFIGDNLALNCACGFSRGFKARNYRRCCTATADECRILTEEVPCLVRTKESYDQII